MRRPQQPLPQALQWREMGLGLRIAQPVAKVVDVAIVQRCGHHTCGHVVAHQAPGNEGQAHAGGNGADQAVELVQLRPCQGIDALHAVGGAPPVPGMRHGDVLQPHEALHVLGFANERLASGGWRRDQDQT